MPFAGAGYTSAQGIDIPRAPRTAFSLALCLSAAVVMVLGIVPRSVLEFAERSILSLLM